MSKNLRHAAKGVLTGLAVGVVLLGVAIGLFVLIWGWPRFVLDFYPLDSSRVGPNLCASITVVILITAHNEYRVVSKAEEHHEKLRQITHDAVKEAIHPAESAEQHVADDVAATKPKRAPRKPKPKP
jgi:hypothetical protein